MKKLCFLFFITFISYATKAQQAVDKQAALPLANGFQNLFKTTEQVETKFFPSDKKWVSRETFLLENLKDFEPSKPNFTEDKFGGIISDSKIKATGFFYTKKIGDRWWIIDPEGNKWYSKGLVAVTPNNSDRGKKVLRDSFQNINNWGLKTSTYIKSLGFNSAGAWSKIQETNLPVGNKLPYSLVLDIMSAFGHDKKVAYQGVGHTSFNEGVMPVFDPDFESFSIAYVAEKVEKYKKDSWLVGYFSDNELNFAGDALNRFLKLPEENPNYQEVKKWATENQIDISNISKANQDLFLAHYVDEYYRVVAKAIKTADPNHLFLSSRLHGGDKNRAIVFKAAGKYSDIISFNYYKSWYPEKDITEMWVQQANKPFMITEWYAKGMDSGMPNETGWGWTVKTQEDRGKYYQNFALALLANKNCVGWQWFKYLDNDPTGIADASNKDANKGIVTWDYKIYSSMTGYIKALNDKVYSLVNYFDSHLK
ncbi:hypothetical protein I5M32_11480 [Pedobacter sp. SD-b]|uniref:Agarase n=1 Tax=Pedobacter segetis TaxID=2793069 RepID=A0ABS1BL11_9SPHI|nr:hypothetical protein [Pedobacter segetis]MBK0383579.1 hypothetical protein [Pedobacter segetis]